MKTLKIERVEKKISSFEYKILLENGNYYILWQDADTEQITLYDQDANKISNVLNCYGAYPPGIKSLEDMEIIILKIHQIGL